MNYGHRSEGRRNRFVLLLALAVGVNVSWAGAITFRVLIDLPARARIGAVAFAELSRATDLSSGLVFYPLAGVGSAVVSLLAWVVAGRSRASRAVRHLTAAAAVSALLVLVVTTRAAPIMFEIGSSQNDVAVLAALADRFSLLTQIRAVLADLAATAVLAALTACALGAGDHRT
jgi:hypothetical protein